MVFSEMLSGNQNATQGVLKGETGTGKELVAQGLRWSSREGPFITVDCGTLMENLAASELFGHCKGAFTEAHVDKRGFLRKPMEAPYFGMRLRTYDSGFKLNCCGLSSKGRDDYYFGPGPFGLSYFGSWG